MSRWGTYRRWGTLALIAGTLAVLLAWSRGATGRSDDAPGAAVATPAPISNASRVSHDVPPDAGVQASCQHRFGSFAPGDAIAYELRQRAQVERLELAVTSVSIDAAITRVSWRADHVLQSGQRRTGVFDTRCSEGEVDLPIDLVGAAGARDALEIPRFPIPSSLTPEQRWCTRSTFSSGEWERCYEVVATGVSVRTAAGHFDTVELTRHDEVVLNGERHQDGARVWIADQVGVVRLVRDGVEGSTELASVLRR